MNPVGQERTQAGPSDVAEHVTNGQQQRETIWAPPGRAVHVDMPNDRYHRLGNWSHSQLKYLPEEPESFEWKFILRRELFEPTRAMIKGTAFHAWLLEGITPTEVPADYLTKSGGVRPGGWDAIAADLPGVPVLKADELVELRYARENCYKDPEIRAYLETAGWVEHSLFAVDDLTGLPTRVRLDKLCRFADGLECLDLKFSGGCDDRWIEQQVTKMSYYSQAGMYWDHVERAYETPKRWVFLFVENTAPFRARLKELGGHDVELGLRHTRIQLADLKARIDADNWNGHGFGIVGITQVAKWKWDENPSPVQPFEEFTPYK
jgi:hypothetical protein